MFGYYLGLAWRRCRRSPAMVALIVLTMAIGIAACMTALTIFDALEGEPLPGISSHLYVVAMDAREAVDKDNPAYDSPGSVLKLRDAKALVDAHRAAGQVALAESYTLVANPDGKQTGTVSGFIACGPVLQVLGVPLRYGRSWTDEEQASRVPVAVIGSKLAEKLFGTVDAVGRSVEMNRHRFRVVGVTAPWRPRTRFIDVRAQQGSPIPDEEQLFVPVGAALDAGLGPVSSGKCGSGGRT